MKAMDRHKARVAQLLESPMEGEELFGQADDFAKWWQLGTGAVGEITTSQLRKKEEKEREKKLKSSEAYKAQEAAAEARKRAELAKAEAITEVDPNGPKHRLAAQLELEAQAAERKAAFFAQQAALAAAQAASLTPGAMVPAGFGPSPMSNLFTPRNLLIGGGIVAGVVVVALLARRR